MPPGSVFQWNMLELSDEQLDHEVDLSYQGLHGHTIDGIIRIPGILDKEYWLERYRSHSEYEEAVQIWRKRHDRAMNELERRTLLS